MSSFKQSLCRQRSGAAAWRRLGLWLLGLCGVIVTTLSQAAVPSAGPSAAAALSPDQVLTQTVQQWVARQRSLQPDQVQLVPLDGRLRVQSCARALVLDHPFASAETVRVRCTEPAWQLYVRVQGMASSVAAATPVTPPAGAGAPVRRAMVVAAQALPRGLPVQPTDLRVQEITMPTAELGAYIEQPSEALHAELLRDVPVGSPIRRSDLRPLVLIKRGQLVQLSVGRGSAFMVSARVEAMQDGRIGESIKLKNPESGRVLSGVVRGPGAVEAL